MSNVFYQKDQKLCVSSYGLLCHQPCPHPNTIIFVDLHIGNSYPIKDVTYIKNIKGCCMYIKNVTYIKE